MNRNPILSDQRHRILHYLMPGLLAQPTRLAIAISCLFGGVLLRIAEPIPLQLIIDRILLPNQAIEQTAVADLWGFTPDQLILICAVSLVGIATLRAVIDYHRTVVFSVLGNQVVGDLRTRVFSHLQTLSLAFHQKARSGDLTIRLISDMNMLKDVTVTAALPFLANILSLIGMFAYMMFLNWRLGLTVSIVVPIFWMFASRKSKKIHAAAQIQRKREGALAATVAESIAAVKTIQAHSAQSHFSSAFVSDNQRSLKEGVKTSRLSAGLERSVDVLIAFVSALVLWQGTRYVMDGSLTAGGLVVYLTYLKRAFRPMQTFAKHTGRLSKALAAGNRISEILDQQPGIADPPDAELAPRLLGSIEFDSVDFRHREHAPLLSNLSFKIDAGQSLAIIGPSGAGKSTVLNLLMRLMDPGSGTIKIDGHEIRNWNLHSFRSQIGVVLQESAIFADTVCANISFGSNGAEQSEIEAAARIANAHEFVSALENGYETILGERGSDLSQGQRQRLAIARAVFARSPILLLDEPTSNLDPLNRDQVLDAIRSAAINRTTIVVTHDLRLAYEMDRILYLDSDGRYEFGTAMELRKIGFGDEKLVTTLHPLAQSI